MLEQININLTFELLLERLRCLNIIHHLVRLRMTMSEVQNYARCTMQ